MHARLYRAVALTALLGSTLISPVRANSPESAIVLITLSDGTACRGPIEGTTFNLVDSRANYACSDGRWILGEPFSLADRQQVAMLARVILQGQRVREEDEPCKDAMCVVGLGLTEVATSVLPRTITIYRGNAGYSACTFQDGETFYLGTTRANYKCDPAYWRKLKNQWHQDAEYWIIGAPWDAGFDTGYWQASLAIVIRQGVVGNGKPCEASACVYVIQTESTFGVS
jgi:hypothetical protein